MQPTELELAAARRYAEALAHFIVAIEQGQAARQTQRLAAAPKPTPAQPPNVLAAAHLLGREDACKLLGIGSRTLHRLSAPRGPIPTVRIGTMVRYRRTDLDRWIEETRTTERKDSP